MDVLEIDWGNRISLKQLHKAIAEQVVHTAGHWQVRCTAELWSFLRPTNVQCIEGCAEARHAAKLLPYCDGTYILRWNNSVHGNLTICKQCSIGAITSLEGRFATQRHIRYIQPLRYIADMHVQTELSGFVIQNVRRKLFWNQAQMNIEESVYCQGWRSETKERGGLEAGADTWQADRWEKPVALSKERRVLGRPRISVIRRRTGATLLQKNDRLGKRLWRSKTTESEGGRGRGAGAFHERSNQSRSRSLSKPGRRRQRE